MGRTRRRWLRRPTWRLSHQVESRRNTIDQESRLSGTVMRLTTVGTGTAAPSAGRVQSGHVIDVGDVHLLMDCGSGVATRLADVAYPWQTITHLAITHFHADHVVDL